MKRSDIFAVLVLGEIAAWLILSVVKGFLKPEIYDKISGTIHWGLPIIFPIACLIFIYVAHMLSKKFAVIYEVAKFILVGGLNTLVDWGILSFLIFTSKNSGISTNKVIFEVFSVTIVYYTLFKAVSFVIATTNSYVWNKFWTFKRKTTETVGKEFTQFLAVSIIGFLINVGIASFIFKFIKPVGGLNNDQWGLIAAAVATVISLIWNFIGYKFIVFEKKNDQPSPIS
jgi:putative flippase GtrA